MSSIARDLMVLLPCSAIVVLIVLKPDIPTIIGTVLKCLLLLTAAIFLINLISRFKNFFTSVRELSPTNSDDNSLAYADAQSRARQNAQSTYNEQATGYLQNVILPKQEKERKAREERFYRITGVPWSSPGHELGGGSKSMLESSLRQRTGNSSQNSHEANDSNPDLCDPGPSMAATRVKPKSLPEEPEINAPNSITIALRSPLGRTHKRRFLVTDAIQLVLNFMASIGYHPNIYDLYLSYPRQAVSRSVAATLQELGIVQGTLLNIEEKE